MGVELAGDGPTASAIFTQANIHSMHSPDIEDLAGGLLVTISITKVVIERVRVECMDNGNTYLTQNHFSLNPASFHPPEVSQDHLK